VAYLLHLLCLLFLFLLLLLLIHLLDLGLVTLLTLFLLLLLILLLRVSHFLLLGLLHIEFNGEPDELRVLLHQILQPTLLQELGLVLLEIADHLGATLDLSVHQLSVLLHGERASCGRLPDVLLIVIVLANDTHLVGHEVCGVEADAKLPNHRDVTACCHCLHECFCSRLCDGAKVVHELILRHANTGVLDGDCRVGLVWDDLDEEVWLCFDLLWVGDGLIADLVQRIRSIGDQFAEEDFLV